MAKLTPYIFSEDAKAQADFYIEALGGKMNSILLHGDLPDAKEEMKDKVMHLCVEAAGVSIFMSDIANMQVSRGDFINLALEFGAEAEAYAAFEKLSEGGVVHDPLKPAFWGSLFGRLQDKFGVSWMITTASAAQEG
ncbi:VOC family protein [Paenibacillus humicola]|uniref:VOC family protein n=1 Tax=Paenibacillus humicola TaxID=3110540 RepID=UPI00237B6E04|nr:VOC family protein [Paenibacillus humicola]